MARPIKQGLDYFPTDTTFWHNLKVRRLRQYCGNQAPHVLLVMLSLAYQEEGYFLEWNEEVCFLVAESAGTEESFVTEVLEKALDLGFFHQEIFARYQVLTSKEIQSRYILATKKRKEVKLEAKYLLELPAERNNLVILSEPAPESPTCLAPASEQEPRQAPEPPETDVAANSAEATPPSASPTDSETLDFPASAPVKAEAGDRTKQESPQDGDLTTEPPLLLENQPAPEKSEAVTTSPLPSPASLKITGSPADTPSKNKPANETPENPPLLQKTAAFQTWQQLWQAPNTLLQAQISRLLQQYSDELVTEAITIAANKCVPKRSGLSFVESCLKKWQEHQLTTLAEVRSFKKQGSPKRAKAATRQPTSNPSQKRPPYRQEKLIDWTAFADSEVTRQTWLKLQKELRQFMGAEFTLDTTFQATPAERRWIFDDHRDYQDEVYLAAAEAGN